MVGETAKTALTTGDNPNIPFPTFGGEVFWNTLSRCNGWRLQQNMITNHARIIDPNGFRRAWGDVRVMRVKFEEMMGCC
ncbi:MAG: hypothetical protein IJP18_05530 [Oscillospiraceae bacterium]|nr:hypothetical protein [Oscillospiraceae bacterium]